MFQFRSRHRDSAPADVVEYLELTGKPFAFILALSSTNKWIWNKFQNYCVCQYTNSVFLQK